MSEWNDFQSGMSIICVSFFCVSPLSKIILSDLLFHVKVIHRACYAWYCSPPPSLSFVLFSIGAIDMRLVVQCEVLNHRTAVCVERTTLQIHYTTESEIPRRLQWSLSRQVCIHIHISEQIVRICDSLTPTVATVESCLVGFCTQTIKLVNPNSCSVVS